MDTISTYKSRIDGLMNILFGAGVSNPQTIIEQINYLLFLRALSVKDDEAELLGIADESGKIFTGKLSKYKWSNLLALNAEDLFKILEESYGAIQKESANATVKLLFRNAHVKIFDKPTLRRVLHEIEEFSKELDTIAHEGNKDVFGDMYEFLLSKLSSAGTNGQFRTPRHIIDFMIRVLDPKIGETILDPACGTAGFLVAAYRYIAGEYTSDKMKKAGSPRAMDKLSSEEKNFLYNHMFTGFDSDEDMIKFGMMNLHLHGLTKSHLVRQNTLTDTTGYKAKFDVILANPPFSGKLDEESVSEDIRMGTKATELLFLRFMIDHLSNRGKMAVVVPEGVLSSSSRANTRVREMLLENGLWCVVSLPKGIFNPYAGVKTNIIFLDKLFASKSKNILFVTLANDGFELTAQRRATQKNDLPEILELLSRWKMDENTESTLIKSVEKSKIIDNADHTLLKEQYEINSRHTKAKYPMIKLGELCEIKTGKKDVNEGNPDGEYPFFTCAKEPTRSDSYSFDTEALLIAGNGDVGAVKYYLGKFEAYQRTYVLVNFEKSVLPMFIYHYLDATLKPIVSAQKLGNTMPYIKMGMLSNFEISLPPLEIQQQIVSEIESHQLAVDEAYEEAERQKRKIKERIDKIWE